MPIHQQRNWIFVISIVGALYTCITVTMAVGEMKGTYLERFENHEKRITANEVRSVATDSSVLKIDRRQDSFETELKNTAKDLEGKIHGVSILVGKSREDIKRTIQANNDQCHE